MSRTTRTTRTTRALPGAALALAAALALTACGGHGGDHDTASSSSSSTIPASEPFNDADVAFATDMIQHHAQALSMVDLTDGRTLSPELTALAEQIRMAQGPEIETMVGWLTDWGQKVPETVRDHANAGHSEGDMAGMEGMEGMDHGDGHPDEDAMPDMPGMMSQQQMADLAAAQGADFEKRWLQMMIEHHEGAVTMARTEVEKGEDADAKDLAASIIDAQRDEIATMKRLLG